MRMSCKTIVLIPSFNGKHLLGECLNSLATQKYKNFKILLVDDASTDGTPEYLRERFPAADILTLPKNRGFVGAVNEGLHYSLHAYNPLFIAILNNDTRVDENWLGALTQRAKSDPRIAAVTSNMFFFNHPEIINSQGGTIDWNGDGYDANFGLQRQFGKKKSCQVLGACWGASLVSAAALQNVGFLDEKFNAYFEDLDWSWRANISGYRIFFEKDAIVYHKHSASYQGNQYRKLYFCKKNALRSAIKNYEKKNLSRQILYILIGYWFAIVGYFQTNKYQLPFTKKIAYISIPIFALGWNILNLPSALRERRLVQQKRKESDETIFKLAKQDPTPVREWIERQKSKFMAPVPPSGLETIMPKSSKRPAYRRKRNFIPPTLLPYFNWVKHRIVLRTFNFMKHGVVLPIFAPPFNWVKHKIVLPIFNFVKHRIVLPIFAPPLNWVKHRIFIRSFNWLKHGVVLPVALPVIAEVKHRAAILSDTDWLGYRTPSYLIGQLNKLNAYLMKNGLPERLESKNIFSKTVDREVLDYYLNVILSDLPFRLVFFQKEDFLKSEPALIIDACLGCLQLSYYETPLYFQGLPQKISSTARYLKDNPPDWEQIIKLGKEANALSQLYFYLKAIEAQSEPFFPTKIMVVLKEDGSHIQNFFIDRIDFAGLARSEPAFFLKLYSKMYMERGLIKYLTTKMHLLYNRISGKAGAENILKKKLREYQNREEPAEPANDNDEKCEDEEVKLPTETQEKETVFGVNIFGFLDSESGVGEAARSLIRAVYRARIPFSLINSTNCPHRRRENQYSKLFSRFNPYPVNIIAIYGDMFGIELKRFGKKKFENRYNIAYWAWELPLFPPEWGALLDQVDEVWTPSAFVATGVKQLRKDIKCAVIPHAIDVEKCPYSRSHFKLPGNQFLFLTMFDFYSIFERKNPLAVIRAFKEAFLPEEPVGLVIKCSNPNIDRENFRLLEAAAKDHNIHLIPNYLDRDEVASLMNVCNCYVSLHRSEGFGLPMAEAMMLRKPVVATNWSGNADFMTEENSFPINYKIIPLERDYGIYRQGNFWADPDEHEASRRMRLVYENAEIAGRKGMFAQRDIMNKLSPDAIGRLVIKNLRRVRRKLARTHA